MLPKELMDILVCPSCKSGLREEADELVCTGCGLCYPVRDGIPIMLIEEATKREGS